MKTIKTSFALLILLTTVNLGFSQNTYLKISLDDKKNNYVSFPPGTKFELKDESEKIVYSDKDTSSVFEINKKYTLTVYPNWKKTTDVFHLTEGKIEQAKTSYYKKRKNQTSEKKDNDYGYYDYDESKFTNGLTMKKTMESSSINPEKFNATFKFNNGIIAKYTDGKMIATLNNQVLKIEGKYLIYSELGVIKLSFRPNSGETWWVFEPVEKSKN